MPFPALLSAIGHILVRGASAAAMGGSAVVGFGARAAGAAATVGGRAVGAAARGVSAMSPMGATIIRSATNVTNNIRNVINMAGQAAQAALPGMIPPHWFGGGSSGGATGLTDSFSNLAIATQALVVGPGSLAAVVSGCASFSRATLGSQEKLREFNGSIAASMATLEHANIMSDIRTGAKTADSTALLTDSVIQMNESLAPIKVALINGTNYVAVVAASMATVGAEIGNFVALATPVIGPLYEWLTRKKMGDEDDGPLVKLGKEFTGIENQWQLNNFPPPMQPFAPPPAGRNP